MVRTYNNDLSKRWRVEWEEPFKDGLLSKRIVKYGNINKGKMVEERRKLALAYIQQLDLSVHRNGETKSSKKPFINAGANLLEKTIQLNSIYWRRATLRIYKPVVKQYIIFFIWHLT